MVRVTQEAWQKERDKMLKVYSQCHSAPYAKEQLDAGDTMFMKIDRLMAETITTVAALYEDGVIKKPAGYPANYPFLLAFMHTNGITWNKSPDKISYRDQVPLQMYMKHHM